MYSNALGRTSFFDENGVREKATATIHYDEDLNGCPPDWSLVDVAGQQPIPLLVTRALPFYFLFASLPFDRFESFMNHGADEWVMPTWGDEELYRL